MFVAVGWLALMVRGPQYHIRRMYVWGVFNCILLKLRWCECVFDRESHQMDGSSISICTVILSI